MTNNVCSLYVGVIADTQLRTTCTDCTNPLHKLCALWRGFRCVGCTNCKGKTNTSRPRRWEHYVNGLDIRNVVPRKNHVPMRLSSTVWTRDTIDQGVLTSSSHIRLKYAYSTFETFFFNGFKLAFSVDDISVLAVRNSRMTWRTGKKSARQVPKV